MKNFSKHPTMAFKIGVTQDQYTIETEGERIAYLPPVEERNAAYLVHAANAYPKLVETLRLLASQVDMPNLATGAHVNAAYLLRELGEAA